MPTEHQKPLATEAQDAVPSADDADDTATAESVAGSVGDTGVTTESEIGGRPGPDPTRYGDWEKNGRCIDF